MLGGRQPELHLPGKRHLGLTGHPGIPEVSFEQLLPKRLCTENAYSQHIPLFQLVSPQLHGIWALAQAGQEQFYSLQGLQGFSIYQPLQLIASSHEPAGNVPLRQEPTAILQPSKTSPVVVGNPSSAFTPVESSSEASGTIAGPVALTSRKEIEIRLSETDQEISSVQHAMKNLHGDAVLGQEAVVLDKLKSSINKVQEVNEPVWYCRGCCQEMCSGTSKASPDAPGRPMYNHIKQCQNLGEALKVAINMRPGSSDDAHFDVLLLQVLRKEVLDAFAAWTPSKEGIPSPSCPSLVSDSRGISFKGVMILENRGEQQNRRCKRCTPNKFRPYPSWFGNQTTCKLCQSGMSGINPLLKDLQLLKGHIESGGLFGEVEGQVNRPVPQNCFWKQTRRHSPEAIVAAKMKATHMAKRQ